MTVTGTEQRVYGTLTGGCIIDLHRFALVSGSTTDSPTTAVTVTYADTTPYKQCGYKYSGYLTLFLSISGSSVYAAVEVRICKNDPKRIVIETYGEVKKVVTDGMSLWFNKGTDKHFPTRDDFPETGSSNVNYINDATGKYYIWNETLYEEGSCWVKLNSTASNVIMPYATISYTFKESKRNGSTTIDCCKKCPSCGCKTCSAIGSVMLSLSYHNSISGIDSSGNPAVTLYADTNYHSGIYPYGYNGHGTYHTIMSNDNDLYSVVISYTVNCDSIDLWLDDVYINDHIPYAPYFVLTGCQWGVSWIDPPGGNFYVNGYIIPDYTLISTSTSGNNYFRLPFDYLKNCIGSHVGGICVDLMTSCNPIVTKGEEECVKSTSPRVSIISNYFSGSFEATVSDASSASNTLTFSDVSFTGSSSDTLSDRSYSGGGGGDIFGTIRYGWMGNTYPTPVMVGYAGPIIGQDIFFVCDVSVTVTGPEGTVVAGKSFMAYTANQAGDSNTQSGTKTVTLSGIGNVGTASFTLNPIKWTSSDLSTYKSKLNIYLHCRMPGADMNVSYQVEGEVSNIRVLNCRYESYTSCIPTGGLSMTVTYI